MPLRRRRSWKAFRNQHSGKTSFTATGAKVAKEIGIQKRLLLGVLRVLCGLKPFCLSADG
jgi:hypothetical protein